MIPSPVPGILGTSPAPKIDIYSGFFATILYFTDDIFSKTASAI